jgi:hypothetical protein
MKLEAVTRIYNELEAENVPLWIDGGWFVDALLGRITRDHPYLDIAVEMKDSNKLRGFLLKHKFAEIPNEDSTIAVFITKICDLSLSRDFPDSRVFRAWY